eukprot:12727736-Alexandrium_andersonii.AAC.1
MRLLSRQLFVAMPNLKTKSVVLGVSRDFHMLSDGIPRSSRGGSEGVSKWFRGVLGFSDVCSEGVEHSDPRQCELA